MVPYRSIESYHVNSKRISRLIVSIAVLLFVRTAFAAPISLEDDTGNTVTLRQAAQRVIALAPSITELVYAAGGGDRLVGAVDFSDFPPQANKLVRVGSNQKLDIECIAALKPDLILVWFHGNAQREVEQLRALGIPMFQLDPKHFDDIPAAMERIGLLLGTTQNADIAAKHFRDRLAKLRDKYKDISRVRVFYQVWSKPLLTINDKHLISEALALCGGDNIFGKDSMLVPQLSAESVVAANPQAILTASMTKHGNATTGRGPGDPAFAMWKPFSGVAAVKTGQMWTIPGDTISRNGPRILDGAEAVCNALDTVRAQKP